MALTTNLVSYWKLDESSGNAADSVGSNTLTNNNTVTYGAAKINNGATGNGSTQYLSIADGSQVGLDITGDMTIALWMKPASVPGSGTTYTMVSKLDADGGNAARSYLFSYRNNGGIKELRVLLSDGSSSTSGAVTQDLGSGTWHHVAAVYTAASGQVEFFADGSSVGTVSSLVTSLNNSAVPFQVLALFGSTTNPQELFNGTLDEIGIWSRALTSGEISSLYNSGSGLSYPFSVASTAHNLSLLGVGA